MIIQNAIKINEKGQKTFVVSSSVHDFREYVFGNGNTYFVDGGNEYLRRGGSAVTTGALPSNTFVEDWSLDDLENTFPQICKKLLWGTRGKDGKQKLEYVLLKDCTTSHLQAILKTQFPRINIETSIYGKVIREILRKRHAKFQFT